MDLKIVLDKLGALSELRPGWDGYGGLAPDPLAVEAARRCVQAMPEDTPTPRVVPMSCGNVQLEWSSGRGKRMLEIEFNPAASGHYLKWHPEEGVEEEGIFPGIDAGAVGGLLRWLEGGA